MTDEQVQRMLQAIRDAAGTLNGEGYHTTMHAPTQAALDIRFLLAHFDQRSDVPVISILKRHLETSVHYQQVASKIGNPEGYAYVKIPDWELRQIIEHLERRNE